MKILYYTLVLLSFKSVAQTTLKFSYDNSGNQILRYFENKTQLEHRSAPTSTTLAEEFLKENDLNDNKKNFFFATPNEVEDILHVKWTHQPENPLVNVSVVAIDGRIFLSKNIENSSLSSLSINVSFLPTGNYILVGDFGQGQRKTFRIIKK